MGLKINFKKYEEKFYTLILAEEQDKIMKKLHLKNLTFCTV